MKILSIETSADETGVALLSVGGPLEKPHIKILGSSLASQIKLHEEYGGIYPTLAKREHEKNLPVLLEETLKQAGENISNPNIDFIAVTAGPGLEPALWAGITFAESLGKKWQKPVLPTNHMEGHIFSVLAGESLAPLTLPALALLVSGGHTELVLVKNFGEYKILGQTLDDAVGEAYDKVARMLGLSYPGGPKISRLAQASREKRPEIALRFPRPMINSKNLNFSFSGLKTAVLYKLKAEGRDDEEFKEDVARAFDDAAIDVLVSKTRKALEEITDPIGSLIVGGGVAADPHLIQALGEMLAEFPHIHFHTPQKALTTDNAVMIGLAAFVQVSVNPSLLNNPLPIKARGNLSISSQE